MAYGVGLIIAIGWNCCFCLSKLIYNIDHTLKKEIFETFNFASVRGESQKKKISRNLINTNCQISTHQKAQNISKREDMFHRI